MAEKYANQWYAVPLVHYDDLFPIYGLLRVAGVNRLALSIDRLYSCKLLLCRSPKSAYNFFFGDNILDLDSDFRKLGSVTQCCVSSFEYWM